MSTKTITEKVAIFLAFQKLISKEIGSKLTIKKPERHHWRRSRVFIINSEHFSHVAPVFLLLILSR